MVTSAISRAVPMLSMRRSCMAPTAAGASTPMTSKAATPHGVVRTVVIQGGRTQVRPILALARSTLAAAVSPLLKDEQCCRHVRRQAPDERTSAATAPAEAPTTMMSCVGLLLILRSM
jgi:cell division ATPase FtsA